MVLREAHSDMNYVASPECVSCAVEEGIAVLDLRSNTYFSLDTVGALVWSRMSAPASLDDLTETVRTEYEVDLDVCRRDITELLDNLLGHDLIQVV